MSLAPGPADVLGLVGTKIDQVRFDACVDAGGFGLIYRGFHEGLGEEVAIKCLRIASIQKTNADIREALAGRFRDETKLLYRLSQGNLDIVRCIGSGTVIAPRTNEYTPYMVLEWLDGCTLSAELKERKRQSLKPRTLDAAVQLMDSAAGGIAYAHAHDVVHRDVKPGNLFLTRTREGVRMKVLDFGLAKILSDESIGVRPSVETGVGVHFCSPSYGAPEQFSGQAGAIGPWTDVYSLTMVLLEVMTGDKVRPAGSLADGLLKALDAKTGSPAASDLGLMLPRSVEALLYRAVAQDPKERPRDAGVFWSELKQAIAAAPKKNLAAATVMDDSVGEAMQQVRDAVVRSSAQPAPFTGTMIMQNAPSGAPHLLVPQSHPREYPGPLPAAGQPPPDAPNHGGGTHPTASPLAAGISSSTAPLGAIQQPEGGLPPAPGPDSVQKARARGELLKGTLPIGALNAMSPLAASMAVPSPLANSGGAPVNSAPPPGYGMQAQQQQQGQQNLQAQQRSYPPGARGPRTDPRMNGNGPPSLSPTKPRVGVGAIIFVVVCLVLAIGGALFYVLSARGH